ncbi:class I SAM-dependent methyltransferase [Sphingosinicella rhizophila]|uniref:Class I SAM-dependent methyltransferase n=1 Tax=Sphingosinicella rhizophila TaxID=3050082 RepID=A0ABU3QB85_9SPHN|nr:class I SAM-dependent methyltransferase [Sphingosinicella sp. GR2756]MDT9600650.1 class I SAM-dependent methyltransferase [Sphingosinicella sp. GR2756]
MILPDERQQAADVALHYDQLDQVYREIWGEHVHHGLWQSGRESPAEAAEALTAMVAERLRLRPDDSVCDIGCGYGASAQFMAERHRAAVTGLTVSAAQARIGQARSPAAGSFRCLHRDWLDNGLEDRSFDAAYAIESSEHMVDKGLFFAEAARVLRPGGRLVVCAWLATERPSRFAVRYLLEPICREGRLPGMGSRSDYERLAADAGLLLRDHRDIGAKVRRTWSICAKRLAARFVSDRAYRRLALDRTVGNRVFLLTVPRLMLALRTGAMRYGVFVWEKPNATQ